MYNILSTGSQGNCVIYLDTIAVDMGISYKSIKPFEKQLQVVLLSHIHSDHLNLSTIKKLSFERPTLRFACGEFLKESLQGIKNVDILESGKMYDYGSFKISPLTLYHDVPIFGYRIFKDGKKVLHITDTFTLAGIEAKDYDLYAIEHNYNDETIHESIKNIESKGGFAYQRGAINSHLSEQDAKDFIFKNAGNHSKTVRLHESKNL